MEADAGVGPVVMLNAFSVDVEDYFQVGAFEKYILRSDWESLESRVEQNTDNLLELFGVHQVRATFFVLGWIAERFPHLVRRIVAERHELAIHGYDHQRLPNLDPHSFRQDVRLAKRIVEDIGGVEVIGYRAPNYSLVQGTMWAPDILLEEGFRYDSSIFPVSRSGSGIPDSPRHPWTIRQDNGRRLEEFPVSTIRLIGRNFPLVGGAYLRHFPMAYILWGMQRIIRAERKPVMVYIHPWEIDPGQPQQKVSLLTRLRHYRNIGDTQRRLEILFEKFRFASLREVLGL